jgi:hypothetical protein
MTSQNDWAKVDATTREEIERQADADDGSLLEGWEDTVVPGIPGPTRGVYLRPGPKGLMAAAVRPLDGGLRPVTQH